MPTMYFDGRGDGHRPRRLNFATTALTQVNGVAPAVCGATYGNPAGYPE